MEEDTKCPFCTRNPNGFYNDQLDIKIATRFMVEFIQWPECNIAKSRYRSKGHWIKALIHEHLLKFKLYVPDGPPYMHCARRIYPGQAKQMCIGI